MRARAGVVLPVVILVLLVIELLAVGALALASLQHRLATDRVLAVRAQLAARAGATNAAWRMSTSRYQALAPGRRTADTSGHLDPHATFITAVERLSGSLFMIRSTGLGGPDSMRGARATAGLLITMPDISEIGRQFEAALSVAGGLVLLGGARVDATQPGHIPIGWPAPVCSSWLSFATAVPGVIAPDPATVLAASSAVIDGQPPILAQPALAAAAVQPHLGSLDFAAVQMMADRIEAGSLTLAPVTAGPQCDTAAAANWGAPL
ncbi:MAG TPA: hypothetical protein VK864_06340, partial [Longimicrobiales bacterium]|nr:hypothetical protein [Longimicrobiales bacterium]